MALEGLDPRSRRIIEARWLTTARPPLHELAAEFDVQPNGIRQIEVKALQKCAAAGRLIATIHIERGTERPPVFHFDKPNQALPLNDRSMPGCWKRRP